MRLASGSRFYQGPSALALLAAAMLPAAMPAQSAPGKRLASAMFIARGDTRELPTFTSAASGVKFDIDGDGHLDQVAWTDPNAIVALLALDENGDGRIASGKELFGSHMVAEAGIGPNALLSLFEASGASISGAVQHEHGNRFRFKGWAELRTGGPEQGRATDPRDHQQRLRHYYEVVLAVE